MSWFSSALTSALPFIQQIAGNKDFQAAGEALFKGVASKIKENIGNPGALRDLAQTLEHKAPEITGAIAAGTPAAKLVSADVMPPGSGAHEGEPGGQTRSGG